MASDDLSVLFRIRGDASGAKQATAEARAAAAQLRQSFGPELAQTFSVTNKVFSQISDNLNVFVGQRIPLVGGAFVRVTEHLRNVSSESNKTDKAIFSVAQSIQSISTATGKSIPQISTFLTKFVQIEGQAKRDAAAIEFFGATTAAKLIPQLEEAGTALSEVASESAAAGGAIAGMAAPVLIALAAVAALTIGVVLAGKEIVNLAKHSVEVDAKIFDLSKQLGVSTELLSALRIEAKLAGGDIATVAQSLGIFQKHLEDAEDPSTKAADLFQKIGVSTEDTESALKQTFTVLAKMPEGYRQTALALELFGRGGKTVLGVLKSTNGDLDAAIVRLKALGLITSGPAAEGADNFADSLDLLDFQLDELTRNIEKAFIPAAFALVGSLSNFAKDNQDVFASLADTIREVSDLIGGALSDGIRKLGEIWREEKPVIDFLNKVENKLKDIQEVVDAINEATDPDTFFKGVKEADPNGIPEIKGIKSPQATPLPTKTPREQAAEAINQAEVVVAASKRAAATHAQALDQLFEQGRITRATQTAGLLADIKRVSDAEIAQVDALLSQKETEIKALNRESEAYRTAASQIVKLQQDRLDKESDFDRQSSAIRAKAQKERADSLRNQEKNNTDILLSEFDRQIKGIEAEVQRGAKTEADGLAIIEQLEQAKIEARRGSVEKQKEFGFLTVQDQKDLNNQIKKLDQDADKLKDEQRDRRLQKDVDAAQRTREFQLQEIDTTLELQRIAGERTIATIEAQAALRVKTEEKAAAEILRIRLDLIDQEIAATQAKQAATKSITSKDERLRVEAELNEELKILNEQRKTIQAEGNRAIDEGRKQDVANEERYADELTRIRERIRGVELDTAREVIRLMRVHFASRKDIIRARVQLDLEEENQRHDQALETLSQMKRENAESNRTEQEKLEFDKEINRLKEAEEERHRLAMKETRDQAKKDEQEEGAAGGFLSGLRTGELKELEGGVQSFADVASVAFSAVGAAVNGLARGIGSMVQQWVLMGSQADISMRKLVATVLAGVAAQAATLAVFELALAIAALTPFGAIIYGTAAQHFAAAALFGSIAIASAVGGRFAAGKLFQQPTTPGGGGQSGGTSDRSQPAPTRDITRNQSPPPQVIILHPEFHMRGDFTSNGLELVLERTIVKTIGNNGVLRDVIKKTAND